jgi:hypothetical protein
MLRAGDAGVNGRIIGEPSRKACFDVRPPPPPRRRRRKAWGWGRKNAAGQPSVPELAVEARRQGYTGDSCHSCGNFTMVGNGISLKSTSPGKTSGCSVLVDQIEIISCS